MTKASILWILKLGFKLLSLVLYLFTLISAYGGYFNPEWWTLPSIGVLFFPYLATATLIVAIIWLISRKFVIGCIGIGILFACGPTFPDALPFRFTNRASISANTFRLVTFNCLHMKDSQVKEDEELPESNRSLNFLINSDADFICLQELYAFGEPEIPNIYKPQIDTLLSLYPYTSGDKTRELEFISKYPFQRIEVKLDNEVKYGSCAAYRINIDGRKLTVINVHLPSYLLSEDERHIITDVRSREDMKHSIQEFEGSIYKKMQTAYEIRAKVAGDIAEFAEKEEGNVIICGDFNDVPGSWSYRLFIKHGFEDAYAQTGFGYLVTYNEHMMWFHIDQILYKGELVPLWVKKERLNSSDHYPLIAEFEFI